MGNERGNGVKQVYERLDSNEIIVVHFLFHDDLLILLA
jgi:hypothetical protein